MSVDPVNAGSFPFLDLVNRSMIISRIGFNTVISRADWPGGWPSTQRERAFNGRGCSSRGAAAESTGQKGQDQRQRSG